MDTTFLSEDSARTQGRHAAPGSRGGGRLLRRTFLIALVLVSGGLLTSGAVELFFRYRESVEGIFLAPVYRLEATAPIYEELYRLSTPVVLLGHRAPFCQNFVNIETDDLAGLVRKMTSRGFVFQNPIREDNAFKYLMIAGPDDLLLELFECREPNRWRIHPDDQDPAERIKLD